MLNLLIKNYGTILIFIIILSFLASYIFYHFNGKSLSFIKKWTLISLRGFVFALIAFLLFNPSIESVQEINIKKKLIVLVDNSTSMTNAGFNIETTNALIDNIKLNAGDNLNVIPYAFDKTLNDLSTYSGDGKYTNITGSLKNIQNQFESEEVHAAILISDGIYNSSYHPKWINPKIDFPIYTVGFGDSIQYADLSIDHIQHNSISYLGNEFPIEINTSTKSWNGKPVQLTIRNSKGKIVYESTWEKPLNIDYNVFKMSLKTEHTGINTYTVQVSSDETEKNIKNNLSKFSIDVLDVKNKILLLASEVHPDHHAIHNSIKSNLDYNVEFNTVENSKNIDLKLYDCVIYLGYQEDTKLLLDQTFANNQAFLIKINQSSDIKHLKKSFPKQFYSKNALLDWDIAQNTINKNFKGFTFSEQVKTFLKSSPPLFVPFTNLESQSPTEHILLQNILGSTNNKGIISIGNLKDVRYGIIQGEGFWKWRMNDFKTNQSFETFDGFIQSVVRLINIQKDKRLFHIDFPSSINQNEEHIIDAKIYNDSYEQITEDEIQLNVKHSNGLEFTFPFNKIQQIYQTKVSITDIGHYTYEIINLSKSNNRLASGEFDVIENNLESQNEVANFEVLRFIANETNGQFINESSMSTLPDLVFSKKIEKNVYTQKKTKGLISKVWILVLILLLGLTEWFLRRKFTLQ